MAVDSALALSSHAEPDALAVATPGNAAATRTPTSIRMGGAVEISIHPVGEVDILN